TNARLDQTNVRLELARPRSPPLNPPADSATLGRPWRAAGWRRRLRAGRPRRGAPSSRRSPPSRPPPASADGATPRRAASSRSTSKPTSSRRPSSGRRRTTWSGSTIAARGPLPRELEPFRDRPDLSARLEERRRAELLRDVTAWARHLGRAAERRLRVVLTLVRAAAGEVVVAVEARLTSPKLADAPR